MRVGMGSLVGNEQTFVVKEEHFFQSSKYGAGQKMEDSECQEWCPTEIQRGPQINFTFSSCHIKPLHSK